MNNPSNFILDYYIQEHTLPILSFESKFIKAMKKILIYVNNYFNNNKNTSNVFFHIFKFHLDADNIVFFISPNLSS
jgi:hypothetical protein